MADSSEDDDEDLDGLEHLQDRLTDIAKRLGEDEAEPNWTAIEHLDFLNMLNDGLETLGDKLAEIDEQYAAEMKEFPGERNQIELAAAAEAASVVSEDVYGFFVRSSKPIIYAAADNVIVDVIAVRKCPRACGIGKRRDVGHVVAIYAHPPSLHGIIVRRYIFSCTCSGCAF